MSATSPSRALFPPPLTAGSPRAHAFAQKPQKADWVGLVGDVLLLLVSRSPWQYICPWPPHTGPLLPQTPHQASGSY
eukprot:877260-Pelagomonas_calceolata.AAC.1